MSVIASPRAMRIGARACALFAAALGALVLAGWLFGIPVLMRIVPGAVAMTPNAAIGFLLAGIALWLVAGPQSTAVSSAAQVAGGSAGLLGLLTLFEYFFDKNLGIDELLFRDPTGLTASYPGRMAVITAVSFVVIAVSLILSSRLKAPRLTDALALIPGLLAFISLTGYFYGVRSLYWIGVYKGMAIHAALAFLALSAGTILRPRGGRLSNLLLSDTAGGGVLRWMLSAAFGVPLLFGWLGLRGQNAGLFQSEFAEALVAACDTVILVVVLCVIAARLNRSEEFLQKSQERLLLSQQAAGIGHFAWDIQNNVNEWSDELMALYGLQPGAFGGKYESWRECLFPGDVEAAEAAIRKSLVTGEFTHDFRVVWPDKSLHWLHARAQVFFSEDGKPLRMVGVNMDVTDRKRASEALTRSEAILRQTQEVSGVGGWEYDVQTQQLTWTDQVYRIYEVPTDYDSNSVTRAIEFYATRTASGSRKRSGGP